MSETKAKSIDSTVFESFDKLTSDKENDRVNGCLTLLSHLSQTKNSVSLCMHSNFNRFYSILFEIFRKKNEIMLLVV